VLVQRVRISIYLTRNLFYRDELTEKSLLGIHFSHRNARRQLINKGYVYTYRKNGREKTGKDWASAEHGNSKICEVHVHRIGIITSIGELFPYIDESGFRTFPEWEAAIQQLNKGAPLFPGYLYAVSVIDDQSS
jgi:hypothetical protein